MQQAEEQPKGGSGPRRSKQTASNASETEDGAQNTHDPNSDETLGTAPDAGGGSSDNVSADTRREEPPAEDPRRVAHELLGQTHALLGFAFEEGVVPIWCPVELQDDVRATQVPLWLAIGRCHMEVSSGLYDQHLLEAGVGGPLGRPKSGLLRTVLKRLSAAVKNGASSSIRRWLRAGASVAGTAISSLAKEVPGGEVIAEAIGGITAGLDALEAMHHDQGNEGTV